MQYFATIVSNKEPNYTDEFFWEKNLVPIPIKSKVFYKAPFDFDLSNKFLFFKAIPRPDYSTERLY